MFYCIAMEEPTPVWRFIDSGSFDGRTNMAVDEALLNCFDPNRSAPVLRLYEWKTPTLSLGRFQKAEKVVDRKKCSSAAVTAVRRITGGGVIYHTAELTYAIVCSPCHLPPAASIKESFRILTSFLFCFYRKLGLDAVYAVDAPSAGYRLGERTDFCFAGRESYDILIGGRKIGGNAQRRQRNVIFQHGSIPLANFASEGASYLLEPPEEIDTRVVALADMGVEKSREDLKGLLVEAFVESMPAKVVHDSLTAEEEREAELLRVKIMVDDL